ncbi:PREDICTED: bcl-2-binding component 3-like [Chrysochloris asiatica]|uniref:Bcl-2-binding component 3-like n=1 Tax=Chrysochloris asiatica TaxID=185453 RepID=A0A9B0WSR6_CHRAS|nr:PREDICTED: bcl-2-binding component 3-like [Chrysochloris asiatica]
MGALGLWHSLKAERRRVPGEQQKRSARGWEGGEESGLFRTQRCATLWGRVRLRAPCARVRRAAGWTRTAPASKPGNKLSSSLVTSSVAVAAAAPRLYSPAQLASPRRTPTRHPRLSGPTSAAPRLCGPRQPPPQSGTRSARSRGTGASSRPPGRPNPTRKTGLQELSLQHRRRSGIQSAAQRSFSSSRSARSAQSAALSGRSTSRRPGRPCPGGPPSPLGGGEKEQEGRAGAPAAGGKQAARQGEREGARARPAPGAAARPRKQAAGIHLTSAESAPRPPPHRGVRIPGPPFFPSPCQGLVYLSSTRCC